MSPFTVIVILILVILFGLLSLAPILTGPTDTDPLEPTTPRTKAAH
jgi:hypothetical protein